VPEAAKRQTETGEVVEGEGWFVRNVADASWVRDATFGVYCLSSPRTRGSGSSRRTST
jgi:hypothetical protein